MIFESGLLCLGMDLGGPMAGRKEHGCWLDDDGLALAGVFLPRWNCWNRRWGKKSGNRWLEKRCMCH